MPDINVNDEVSLDEHNAVFRNAGVDVYLNGSDVTEDIKPSSFNVQKVLSDQPSTCSFTIEKYESSTTKPQVSDVVKAYIDADKIFAGEIIRVKKSSNHYKIIDFNVECKDWTHRLDRQLVADTFKNETIGNIIDDITNKYLSDDFTTNNVEGRNTTIDFIGFNYEKVSEVFRRLADLINYDWYVDFDKDIHFFDTVNRDAPFDIVDGNESYVFDSMNVREDVSQLRNKVIVHGGEYLADTQTASFQSNGVQNQYTLPYQYKDLDVTVTGEKYSGGVDGQDSIDDHDYLWNKEEKFIRFNNEKIPSDNVEFSVFGQPYLPVRIVRQDPDSIDTFGEYQHIIRDKTIDDKAGARQRARAELRSYKTSISEGSFTTRKKGLKLGQTVHIDSNAYSIDKDFFINKINISMRNNKEVRYEINLVTTKTVHSIKFLQKLLTRNDRTFEISQGEIVDLIRSESESFSFSESVTVRPLDYELSFVAGEFEPSGNKRVFLTNSSYLGGDIHPNFNQDVSIRESVTISLV